MTLPELAAPHDSCGARTRAGSPCRQPRGWGTDHIGTGRCKLHGGRSPIKHGRYSQIKRASLREAQERFRQDTDPLDLGDELAMSRALIEDYINSDPADLDIEVLAKLIDGVTKSVLRIGRIESKQAIKRQDFFRVLQEMGRVVGCHVTDQVALERIKSDWLALRV